MQILQVGASLDVTFGGTASSCAQLANQLSRIGVAVGVLTLRNAPGRSEWPLDEAVVARQCTPAWPAVVGYAPDCGRVLDSMPRPDVVHVHGLWRVHFRQAAAFARRVGAPVVVTVHGMLYAHNLKQRATAKRAIRRIYQDAMLHDAACLHATADDEVGEIRREGFARPVAVLPWGVDWPDDGPPRATSPRSITYVGRLHPLKRLDTLVRAWARVQPQAPGWSLVFTGPAEPGYDFELAALASELGVGPSVRFTGVQRGAARERLFGAAAVVVQPSPAENFSLAIAEALARGVPAIATHGAPWAALERERCGWWVPAGTDGIASALRQVCAMDDGARREMGERARRFARDRFDWPSVAASMRDLYLWLLGRGPEPSFVRP